MAAKKKSSKHIPSRPANTKEPSVYIFEDSNGWREILRKLVESAGFRCNTHYREAPWRPDPKKPAQLKRVYNDGVLFIIDIRLPDEYEGLDLARDIRDLEHCRGIEEPKALFLVSVLHQDLLNDELEKRGLVEEGRLTKSVRFFHKSNIADLGAALMQQRLRIQGGK